jgi:hypothetical protein
MDKVMEIDERVIQRAMKPFPNIKEIVPYSTPVVSFGNPTNARVLTVGINPSSLEFLTAGKNKKVLPFGEKRLVDLEVLGINEAQDITREAAVKVIQGCYGYFDVSAKPYMTWFKHLNENVNKFFNTDYREKSAAHVDLVQWATDPVWGNISNPATKNLLLDGDVDFLRYQIDSDPHEVVFLNGKQVFEQLTEHKIVSAKIEQTIHYQTKSGKSIPVNLYLGSTANRTLVMGWSRTFPGHHISDLALPNVVEQLHNHFNKYSK